MDNNDMQLQKWIETQRQASDLAKGAPAEIHLHHHHAPQATPQLPPDIEAKHRMARMHPLMAATYMLFLSVAISIPLALIAAIIESSHRPSVQYIQPSGRW